VTDQERQDRLERLRQCIKLGEDAYDQMYEPRTHNNPAGHYSDAKDYFCEAIGLARELDLNEQGQALRSASITSKPSFAANSPASIRPGSPLR